MAQIVRPYPPEALTAELETEPLFAPAPEVQQWITKSILTIGGPLHNPDHEHLALAHLGVLWTNVVNVRQGRRVIATAEIPRAQGSIWQKTRADYQLTQWFGKVPDFLLTFDAGLCNEAPDTTFCAWVEHELYHCRQKLDLFGSPKFTKDGDPQFCIQGHDVEEHLGVVRRYGLVSPELRELAKLAQQVPEVAHESIAAACGTCSRAVA